MMPLCASSFLAAGVAQEGVVVNSVHVLSSRFSYTAHVDMLTECFSAHESMNAQYAKRYFVQWTAHASS